VKTVKVLILKTIPKLKAIFDKYYSSNPRKFIEILNNNKGLSVDLLLDIFEELIKNKGKIKAIDVISSETTVDIKTLEILSGYSDMAKGGDF